MKFSWKQYTGVLAALYLFLFIGNASMSSAQETYNLLDYQGPFSVGTTWLYSGHDWDGNISDTRVEVISAQTEITYYTDGDAATPYTANVIDVQYDSGTANPDHSINSTDEWHEYMTVSDGYRRWGSDDDGENFRVDGGLNLGTVMTVGQSVQDSKDIYFNGTYSGTITVTVSLLDISNVTVPAGTFNNCLHLRFTFAGELNQSSEEWWAPGVGMVKLQGISGGGSERTRALTWKSFDVIPDELIEQEITVAGVPSDAKFNEIFSIQAEGGASGNPVLINTSGVCSGSGNNSADITMTSGTGICTITFNQEGNEEYNPAPTVTFSVTAVKEQAYLFFTNPMQGYDGSPKPAAAVTYPADLSNIEILYDGTTEVPSDPGKYRVSVSLTNSDYQADNAEGILVIYNNESVDFWQHKTHGLYGGTVNKLIILPGGEIIAGSYGSGLFRSTNNGDSWTQVYFDEYYSYINALGVNSSGQVFAGDYNLLRSSDGGLSWEKIGNINSVTSIAFDSEDKIYVTNSMQGVQYSADNGNTWVLINNGLPGDFWFNFSDITINADGDLFVVSTEYGIYRSEDNGNTWAAVNSGIEGKEVSCLTIDSAGMMFVGTGENGVFSSADNGDTWIPTGLDSGWIYSLETDYLTNTLFAGIWRGGVAKSDDSGASWSFSGPENTAIRSLAVAPSGDVFAGSDGEGVLRSSDNGTTWLKSNNGLTNAGVVSVVSISNGDIFAATQNNGVYRTVDSGENWSFVGFDKIYSLSMAVSSEDHIFIEADNIYRSTDQGSTWAEFAINLDVENLAINSYGILFTATSNGVFRSVDNGETWETASSQLSGRNIWGLVIDSHNNIYISEWGGDGGILKSSDNGETWESKGLLDLSFKKMAVDSLGNIYAAGDGTYKSSDNGETWENILPVAASCVFVDSFDSVYISTGSYGVFRSSDYGNTWTRIIGGLNARMVNEFTHSSDGYLYAATGSGVFRSSLAVTSHTGDADSDGISDAIEMLNCTNHLDADTDDDGLDDGAEDVNHNGIVDDGETNPCILDTDLDGMPDGWEVQYGLDPLVNDADEDLDGDGNSNYVEYLNNTNPNDSGSYITPSGTLTQDEVWSGQHLILSDVIVPEGVRLTIMPGTSVYFDADSGLAINGELIASGTAESPILFTSSSSTPSIGIWDGIRFNGTSLDTSILEHVVIEYGDNGVFCNSADPIIRNSVIRLNTNGISANLSSPLIERCIINQNSSRGINCNTGSRPVIRDNHILQNETGIYIYGASSYNITSPEIRNNILRDNSSYGIYLSNYCDGLIEYNTILSNGDGVHIAIVSGYTATIDSNIITHNSRGLYSNIGAYLLEYNDVWENRINYEGLNSGVTDMNLDPQYVDFLGEDFTLQEVSPLLSAGSDNGEIGAYGNGGDPVDFNIPLTTTPTTSGTLTQNEIWSGNITITGDVFVPANYLLVIEPGTNIAFDDNSGLSINGRITAIGTEAEPILFTSSSSTPSIGIWDGIRFDGASLNTSILEHVVIEYGDYGVYCNSADPIIRDSVIRLNTNGIIADESNSLIERCIINQNSSRGINCNTGSRPVIRDNHILQNETGIYVYGASSYNITSPEIRNNILRDNSSYGIYLSNYCDGLIEYNTILSNGDGVHIAIVSGYTAIIDSNIITHNSRGLYSNIGAYLLEYNDVWENRINYEGLNSGVTDMNLDPQYVDFLGEDFTLQEVSPLLSAGSDNGEIGAYGNGGDPVDFNIPLTTTPTTSGTLTLNEIWSGNITITGDVFVPANYLLVIEPGTNIAFDDNSGLSINGRITAIGTEAEPILFTSSSSTPSIGIWDGIRFDGASLNTSILEHVVIEYGDYGVFCNSADPIIRDSVIRLNTNGIIADESNSLIERCIINQNISRGINCKNGSNPVIKENHISQNETGIYVYGPSIYNVNNPEIRNNIIRDNSDYGISVDSYSEALIVYNTILSNGDGLHINTGSSYTTVINSNILTNNSRGIYRYSGTIELSYNDVWGNTESDSNVTPGTGDISEDPLFVSTEDFHLLPGSPCIDSGDPSRVDQDETRSDMGCYGAGNGPEYIDRDGDGFPDPFDPDPLDADIDDDGILDGIEDTNHNGLVDEGETDPCLADSDGDGLTDGEEDSNFNGLVDDGETDPRKTDTDNDGFNDGDELASGTSPTDPNDYPVYTTITGTVYDDSGEPIRGVSIQVIAFKGDPCGGQDHLYWTATDPETGQYTIDGLTGGDYYLLTENMNQSNYVREYWTGDVEESSVDCASAVSTSVSPGTNNVRNFMLELGGSISGTVTDSVTGAAIVNMEVNVQSEGCEGKWLGYNWTDEDGNYTIYGLPSGNVLVHACPNCSGLNYADEWFEEKHNFEDCSTYTPVSVTPDEDHGAVNFVLDQGGIITGTVYDNNGDPVTGKTIQVIAFLGDPCGYQIHAGWAETDPETGQYAMTGLAEGEYYLLTSNMQQSDYVQEFWIGGADESSVDCSLAVVTQVNIGSSTERNFKLESGGVVSGTVIDSDTGLPIANLHVYAMSKSCEGSWLAGNNTDENGVYTIYGLPQGDVYVNACASCSGLSYADEWYEEKYIYEDCYTYTPVSVISGENHTNINFALGSGGGISGTVYDDNGEVITGIPIQVIAFQGDPCGEQIHVAWTLTDPETGQYTIENIPADDFYLVATDMQQSNYKNEYWTGGVEESSEDCSLAVLTVSDDSGTVRDFKLEPGGEITGTVYDENGIAITGVSIGIIAFQGDPCGEQIHMAWGQTDPATGQYSIKAVSEGDYYLLADNMQQSNYLNEYWTGGTDESIWDCRHAAATSVNIGSSTVRNFKLELGGSISGVVSDSITGQPISNLHVYVQEEGCGGAWLGGTFTNEDGEYIIYSLPAGNFYVRAYPAENNQSYQNEGYEDTYDYVDCNSYTPVSVTSGENHDDIDFALEPGGKITGTVYDDNGDVITGVPVQVIAFQGSPCGEQIHMGWAATDPDTGQYTMNGLPPGDYYLLTSNMQLSNYIREYWTGGANESSLDCNLAVVTSVSVDSPVQRNFKLGLGGSVSGFITDSTTGQPIPDFGVNALSDACSGYWLEGDMTDSDGRYTIYGLPEGDVYVASCSDCNGQNYVDEWFENTYEYNDCNLYTPVSVTTGEDHGEINFELEPGAEITGTVYDDNDNPVTGNIIQITAFQGDPCGEQIHIAWSQTDPETGQYVIKGLLPGEYYLFADGLQESNYVREYWSGGDDQSNKDCNLAVSTSVTGGYNITRNFRLELGGSISGAVTDSDTGSPIPDLHVYVELEGCSSFWLGGVNTDDNGEYTISGLPSGTVYVRACPGCSGQNYRNEGYYEQYDYIDCNQYTPVSVVSGENNSGIDFQLELDTDGDFIPDTWETGHGMDPLDDADVYDDPDSDGLNNFDEYLNNTHPFYTDSDGDGIPDGEEIGYGTNPNSSDTDNDGFSDRVELNTGSDPNNPDIIPPVGSISGTVRDSSGVPITGVSIEVTIFQGDSACFGGSSGLVSVTAVTDPETGIYSVSNLPEGGYFIKANDTNHVYAAEYFNSDSYDPSSWDCDLGVSASVTADQTTADIDFKLGLAGVITGRVTGTDTGGDGIENISITTHKVQNINSGGYISGQTDSDGYYTIYDLPLGETFYLRSNAGFFAASNYVNVWYDENIYAYLTEGAEPVVVQENTVADFELIPGETISGSIKDLNTGDGVSTILVMAAISQCDYMFVSYGFSDAEGNYTIKGLPPGESFYIAPSYILQNKYVAEWYDNVRFEACDGATPVLASSTGIDFYLDIDSDGDGISDEWENSHGLNPYNSDTDNDLMPDRWELNNGLDPVVYDGDEDLDGDFLTNQNEYENNTDPNDSDSDDDGVNDYIEVNSGTDPTVNSDFPLTGSIYGTVYDRNGLPVTGISIEVNAYQAAGSCYYAQPGDNKVSAFTDPVNGKYIITGLPAGKYYIKASDQTYSYAMEYYSGEDDPSSWNCEDGVPVDVIINETAGSIDFELVMAGTVSGRVTDSVTGEVIENINVQVLTGNGVEGSLSSVGNGGTDSDGLYTIKGVPLGESFYVKTVFSFLTNYDYVSVWYAEEGATYLSSGADSVVIETNTEINFQLEHGESISGQITDADSGNALQYVFVIAYENNCNSISLSAASTDAEGNYTLTGLPSGGEVFINVISFFGNYQNEWYNNAYDCANAVSVTAPASAINFELFVDSDSDGLPDSLENLTCTYADDADSDDDGIPDGIEDFNKNGTVDEGESSPCDADTDDDGISDGNEDRNHDGIIDPSAGETDPVNPDTDGDSIFDGTETGLTEPDIPGYTDMSAGNFIPDADSSTKTDPNSNDSDNDGMTDDEEDINKNGKYDDGETDPNVEELVAIPDVAGMEQASAETQLEAIGLKAGSVTGSYSNTVLAGDVISQSPSAGVSVLKGSMVDMLVSLGCRKVTVPSLIDLTEDEALDLLAENNLYYEIIFEVTGQPEGNVFSQVPAADEWVCENSTVSIKITGNNPPSASAGTDQTVNEGVVVTLNGSNTYDIDGNLDSYEWEQTDGPAVALSDIYSATPTFKAPDVGPDGVSLAFKMSATDTDGLSDSDTCIINVSWLNEVPVAEAGDDQTVDEGEVVTLDGSYSYDHDDGIVAYQWSQIAGITVELSESSAISPTFDSPDVSHEGESVEFELLVTDNGGLKSTDRCIVNITWLNEPPVADAGSNQTADEGSSVTLDGSGSSDPDDGIASYEWSQISGTTVTLSDNTSFSPTFTLPDVGPEGESLIFKLTVTDNGGLKSSSECTVKVNPGSSSQLMSLSDSWNLISMYQYPSDSEVKSVLDGITSQYISVWSYSGSKWYVYDPDNPDFSDLTEMAPGKGYWINMKNVNSVNISGSSISDSIDLDTGWNLVGYNSIEKRSTGNAVSSIQDDVISVWSYENGKWYVYDPDNPDFSDLIEMKPGLGYWINTAGPCEWLLP